MFSEQELRKIQLRERERKRERARAKVKERARVILFPLLPLLLLPRMTFQLPVAMALCNDQRQASAFCATPPVPSTCMPTRVAGL